MCQKSMPGAAGISIAPLRIPSFRWFISEPHAVPASRHPSLPRPAVAGDGSHAASDDDAEPPSDPIPVVTQAAELRTMSQVIVGLGTCEAPLNKTAALAPAVEGRVVEDPRQAGPSGQGRSSPSCNSIQRSPRRISKRRRSPARAWRHRCVCSKALPRPEEQKLLQLAIDDAKASVQKAESLVARLQPLFDATRSPQQQMLEAKLALDQARVQQQKAEVTLKLAMLGARHGSGRRGRRPHHRRERGRGLGQGTTRSAHHPLAHRRHLGQDHLPARPVADGGHSDRRSRRSAAALRARLAPDADARLVQAGQPARVSPDDSRRSPHGAQAGKTESFAGTSSNFVGQVVDPQTGNLPVRVLVENPRHTVPVCGSAGKR